MLASHWRLLQDEAAGGPWNMAVDEAVARAVGDGLAPPSLRFYAWSAPTVSFGYLQQTPGGVDLEACRRLGIPLLRRVTGGRAVLHAQELTYAVALPLSGHWRGLSVSEVFDLVGRGLIAGLKHLGVKATLGEAGAGPAMGQRTGACFLVRRMPAILVGGRKLIGSAQRRFERSVLQHGSLLRDFDVTLHQAVFSDWPRIDPAAGITSLGALLGTCPPIRDLTAALVQGWREAFAAPCIPGGLTSAEQAEARVLAAHRYGSPAWTFQR